MYRIAEWKQRYEVNDKGDPAKDGDKLRVKPLDYIRSKVFGRARGAGFGAMQRLAGPRAYEVFGMFHKFLEIAGCEESERRGVLLNARGEPATIEDLAFILGSTVKKVEFTLQVLSDKRVGWLLEEETPENFRKTPEKSGRLYNRTEPNRNEDNRIEPNRRTPKKPENTPPEPPAAKASDSVLNAPSSSARLGFGLELRKRLDAKTSADCTALANVERWLNSRSPPDAKLYVRVLELATESQSGRNPKAVFFSKLDKELGYRPQVEAEKKARARAET